MILLTALDPETGPRRTWVYPHRVVMVTETNIGTHVDVYLHDPIPNPCCAGAVHTGLGQLLVKETGEEVMAAIKAADKEFWDDE